jgi:hypothetical protein
VTAAAVETYADRQIAARYESLIRLSQAIRAHRDPAQLFDLLVKELRQVVPFDAIAQYDDQANKTHWHKCGSCRQTNVSGLPCLARKPSHGGYSSSKEPW